ncbi:MAG: ABC transporter substrate-binding protein [Spirochaetaceae bacterium]|nr:MAG: ABC transporter substrate-binding protein [Spirochaetaceae bacterium]
MSRSTQMFVCSMLVLVLAVPGLLNGAGRSEAPVNSLRMALSGDPNTLDPHATSGTLTFQVLRSVYDTLAEPNEDGEIVPALAERWDVSDDATEWTFFLRRDVQFHNGAAFSARDVVATFERLRDSEAAFPNVDEFGPLESVRALDDYTVQFRMFEPFAPLLAALASGWGAILPADLIAEGHDFDSRPVGTGPFVFGEWIRDGRIRLSRNEAYWIEGQPYLDELVFQIITEPAVQLQGLLAGDFDVIDIVPPDNRQVIIDNPRTRIDESLSSLIMVMAMNTSRAPLNVLDVRRAINHAVNRQQILDVAYGGGQPGATFMDTGDFFHVDYSHLYPYDPAQARELLAQSGADFSRPLTLTLPQNFEPHVVAGQMYQEMLRQVGLDVNIRLVDWSTWISDVYGRADFDLTVIGHTGKLDPDGRLANMASEEFYVRWTNREATSLIRQARQTGDIMERQNLYARVLEIIAQEVPKVYTGTNYRQIGLRTRVRNFHMDSQLDTYDFRRVTLDRE